jgi:hypothetical protein
MAGTWQQQTKHTPVFCEKGVIGETNFSDGCEYEKQVRQYKSEQESNAVIHQRQEEKIAQMEKHLPGGAHEFHADELSALSLEFEVQKRYLHHKMPQNVPQKWGFVFRCNPKCADLSLEFTFTALG